MRTGGPSHGQLEPDDIWRMAVRTGLLRICPRSSRAQSHLMQAGEILIVAEKQKRPSHDVG